MNFQTDKAKKKIRGEGVQGPRKGRSVGMFKLTSKNKKTSGGLTPLPPGSATDKILWNNTNHANPTRNGQPGVTSPTHIYNRPRQKYGEHHQRHVTSVVYACK